MALGTLFLLDRLEIFETSAWEVAWPIGLVVIGLWLLTSKPWHASWGGDGPSTAAGDDVELFSLMAGRNQRITSRAWRGGEVTAIMGGAEVHLDDALPVGSGARLQATAIMGGVELKDA